MEENKKEFGFLEKKLRKICLLQEKGIPLHSLYKTGRLQGLIHL